MGPGDIKNTVKASPTPPEELTQELTGRLIDAAIACFSRFGVERTRIEDVAAAADLSRATFYRYFQTREELIDAVVVHQLNEVVDRYGPGIRRASRLETALVKGSVNVLLACRENAVFMELLHRARGQRLSDLAEGTAAFFEPVATALWAPAIEAAKQRGELRRGITTDEIVRWISSVHLLFLLRDNLVAGDIERSVKTFIVPALVTQRVRVAATRAS